MSSELSGKKALLLVAAAIIGIFFVLEALFGFPIFKPKSDIVDDNAVIIMKKSRRWLMHCRSIR